MSRHLEMPKVQKSNKRLAGEPSKPSKPGFDGFEGSPDDHFQKNTLGLVDAIKRMAAFYGYTPAELTLVTNDARQNPDRWRTLIRIYFSTTKKPGLNRVIL